MQELNKKDEKGKDQQAPEGPFLSALVSKSSAHPSGVFFAFLRTRVLNDLKPEAASAFTEKFLAENGSTECKVLRGKCNDMVGCAARLVEELMG